MIEANRYKRNQDPTALEEGADILLNASDLPSKEEVEFKKAIEDAYRAVFEATSMKSKESFSDMDYVDMSRNAGILTIYNREAEVAGGATRGVL